MSSAQPVSSEENAKHLVVRWFEEVWNQGRRETIAELLPAGSILHDGSIDITGPAEFMQFYNSLHAQFSDFRITPGISLAEGDLISMRWSADFKDKATGKPLHTTGISIVRVENGVFAEAWQNWDAAGIADQLKSATSTP